MSKGNMFLGYARGKVGSIVFSRRKGEQVTRARNTHPANPRTPRQVFQRMKMYAPVSFYKASIATQFKYAFEDQRPNETAFNAFIRHNIANVPWTSKTLANEYAPIPFKAVMSDGSAPNVDAWIGDFYTEKGISLPDSAGVGLFFGQSSVIDNGTIGEISRSLLSKYPLLREGDLITLVAVRSSGLAIEGGDMLYSGESGFYFSYVQFVINSEDTAYFSSIGLVAGWAEGDEQSNPTGVMFPAFAYPYDNEQWAFGGCVIVSRKVDGKVIASNSVLELNNTGNEWSAFMRTEAYRDKAALTYGVGTPALLDPIK